MGSKPKRNKWWIWALALGAAALAAVKLGADPRPEVEAAYPQRASIEQEATAYGFIRPVSEVKISPDVSGEIVAVYFEEGDSVHAGDLLLKIKQESCLNTIARCEAALGSARQSLLVQQAETSLKKLEYQRALALYDSDASCLAQLETARYAYESSEARSGECQFQIAAAKASLDAARSELARTLVYSPMDGIVTSLRVKTGERVVGTGTMAGTEVVTIADLEHMELVVELGQNDVCGVKEGDLAKIRPDAAPETLLEGRVSKIAVCAQGGGTIQNSDFEVRISIDNQDNIRLLPGMSASVSICTGSKNDILTVPLQAVIVRDGQEKVWTIGGDGRVGTAAISCGIRDFNRAEVTSGLEEGDLIVTGPFQTINKDLNEGDKVKIRKNVSLR